MKLRIADCGLRIAAACLLVVALVLPAFADSKADSLKPVNEDVPASVSEAELRKQLEAEYRVALEKRLAQEKESYEGSLRSLWIANSAVWGMLLLFVVMQALSARKRERELERLRGQSG